MATQRFQPPVTTPKDERTLHALKEMEAHIKHSQEVSNRALIEACRRQLEALEGPVTTKEPGVKAIKGLAMPPNVELHRPREARDSSAELLTPPAQFTVTRPIGPLPATMCVTSLCLPPYIGGIPDVPVIVTTPGAGIVLFEEILPEVGRLELEAVTFNNDPTAQGDSFMVHKVASDNLLVCEWRVPSIAGPATLTVTAPVVTKGNTLVFARGLANPTGSALIHYSVRLDVLVLRADGTPAIAETTVTPVCRVAAGPPFSYDQGVQNLNFENVLTANIPVSTADLVLVGLHVELFVGVSSRSNLYVTGNFSRLRSFWQGPGIISLADLGLAIC